MLLHLCAVSSVLSQEIADGVNKSAQAVQAAEAGVRQIGSLARQQTMGKMLLVTRNKNMHCYIY